MSTQSIFTNIVINTPEEAENLVRALEEAEKLAEMYPLRKVDVKVITKENAPADFRESIIRGLHDK